MQGRSPWPSPALPLMRTVRTRLPAGSWPRGEESGTIRLDHDLRHRRRLCLVSDGGEEFLLDLAETTRLEDGDALVFEDGTLLRVIATPEPLLDIHAHDERALVRIAWHLGNRHLAVEIAGDHLRIRPDPVIAAMVEGLGGHVAEIEAVFTPESGAYAAHPHEHG